PCNRARSATGPSPGPDDEDPSERPHGLKVRAEPSPINAARRASVTQRYHHPAYQTTRHPAVSRRFALQAGAVGLLGLGMDHPAGHHIMLTGRSDLPAGFDPNRPKPTDWPSIAAVAGTTVRSRNNLPPAVVLPERLVHNTGRVIPGQFAGTMGPHRDPWFVE